MIYLCNKEKKLSVKKSILIKPTCLRKLTRGKTYVRQNCDPAPTCDRHPPRPGPAWPVEVSCGGGCSSYPAPEVDKHTIYHNSIITCLKVAQMPIA